MIPTKHDNIFDLYLKLNIELRHQLKTALSKELKVSDANLENWITTKSTPNKHQDTIIKTLQNITAINTF